MLFNFFVGLISLSYPYPNFPIFDWKHGIKHLKKNSKDFLSSAIAKCVLNYMFEKSPDVLLVRWPQCHQITECASHKNTIKMRNDADLMDPIHSAQERSRATIYNVATITFYITAHPATGISRTSIYYLLPPPEKWKEKCILL